MTQSGPIKILLADDHMVVRSGLSTVLAVYDDMKLVGEAGDGEEAVRLCERLQPDVVLMDLLMPRMDGVTATRIIKERWPKIQVIALTSFKEKEYVEGAIKAGANGYLLKEYLGGRACQRCPPRRSGPAEPFAGGCAGAYPKSQRACRTRLGHDRP